MVSDLEELYPEAVSSLLLTCLLIWCGWMVKKCCVIEESKVRGFGYGLFWDGGKTDEMVRNVSRQQRRDRDGSNEVSLWLLMFR